MMSSGASTKITACEEARQAEQSVAEETLSGAPMTNTTGEPVDLGIPSQDIKHSQEAQAQEQKQIPVWRVIVLTIRFASYDVLYLPQR